MKKRLCFPLFILLFTGCGRQSVPEPPRNDESKQPPRAEFRIGDDLDQPHQLPFKIIAVHENQKPSKDAPFHVRGGEWTFFDCQASGDPNVAFTVGVASKKSAGNAPIAWGRAVLILKDREAGGRFVALFSKSFPAALPKAMDRPHVPKPLSINMAILGINMGREAEGGFVGEGGGWTTTKWFLEDDGRSGEVYFNYNLTKRQGEFSEKDAEYVDDLVAIFASALRDGPRPERTPENDPNLTRIGPKIRQPRKLLSRLASHYSFSPKGRFAVYQDGTTIFALVLDKPDGKPFEIGRFDHSPWEIRVLDEDLNLLVQEGIPEKSGMKSSADPMCIWWVEFKNKTKKQLRGPEKNLDLAEAAISPDHRYVVLDLWRGTGKGRTKLLHILDRNSGMARTVESQGKDLSLIAWKTTEAGLRAVAVTNRWLFDKNKSSESYLIDPATGEIQRKESVDARFELDNLLSPDGKHRVRVGKDELIVTNLASGQKSRFIFHKEDRRFVGSECIEWVSPRYLKFNGPRLALIDVTTMKMCYPASADGTKFGSHSYKFSPDFRWVLYQGETSDGEKLFLAPVEMPKEP